MAELVWYVAYGSNLSRERFADYVADPHDDRPTTIGHRVWFGGESKIWTGGRAYLDHEAAPDRVTLARAWLLDRKIIANEVGIPGRQIGSIDIYDRFAFVEVPSDMAQRVVRGLAGVSLRGRPVKVSLAKPKG